jgi:hypothetical protein
MRLSVLLDSIISRDPALQYGLHHRLLNLSELARFLEPTINTRIKGVSESAIVMALSRYQRVLPKKMKRREAAFRFSKIKHENGLILFSIEKTARSKRIMHEVVDTLHNAGGYLTVTEGDSEFVLVALRSHAERIKKFFALPKNFQIVQVDAIILRFDRTYLPRPGFLYLVLQQLALQQVSVVELASTATEFILFLDPQDVEVALTSLSKRFGRR